MAGEYFVVPVDLQHRLRSTRYSPRTLSRSNLIGAPQRLRVPHNRTTCAHCVCAKGGIVPFLLSLIRVFLERCHVPAKGERILGRGSRRWSRQCCSIRYCSVVVFASNLTPSLRLHYCRSRPRRLLFLLSCNLHITPLRPPFECTIFCPCVMDFASGTIDWIPFWGEEGRN